MILIKTLSQCFFSYFVCFATTGIRNTLEGGLKPTQAIKHKVDNQGITAMYNFCKLFLSTKYQLSNKFYCPSSVFTAHSTSRHEI